MLLNLAVNVVKPELDIGSMSFKPGLVGRPWLILSGCVLTGPIHEVPGNKLKHSF